MDRVGDVRCQLGEGPVWDVTSQRLYFVDVFGKALWRHDPASGAFDRFDMPFRVSALALCEGTQGAGTGAVLALETGLGLYDFTMQALRMIGNPAGDDPAIILNDGKADPRGRFLIGTVDTTGSNRAGLFSLSVDGDISQLDDGFSLTNGPCWSPDGGTFYFADSQARRIYAYDYDLDRGTVANRRLFADTSVLRGIPDGATVDSEGKLWTALCDGAKLACFAPDGSLVETIDCPTGFVSSVMFGGPALDRLYMTSIDGAILGQIAAAAGACHGLDDLGGSLFAIDRMPVTGLPEYHFGGGALD